MSRQGESLWPEAYDSALIKWSAIAPKEHVGLLEDFMHQHKGLAQTAYTATWSMFYHAPPSEEILQHTCSLRSLLGVKASECFTQDFFSKSAEHAAVGIECLLAASVMCANNIVDTAANHDIRNPLLIRQVYRQLDELLTLWKSSDMPSKEVVEHVRFVLKNPTKEPSL
jgi:hypothetical protein